MTTYNNSDVRILGDVELVGALSFEKNYTDFPANPKPRTIVVKAGIAYIYTELVNGSGTWTWQPIGLKQTAYKHVQADPSTTWVVPHNFNSNDFAYFVYDENHNLVIANVEIVNANTARIVLSQATAGMAIFFSIEYVGAQVISAATSVNINGLVLTNGDGELLVNGTPIASSGGVAQSYVDAADAALGGRISAVGVANELFVNKGGNNTTATGSIALPFLTVQAAIDYATTQFPASAPSAEHIVINVGAGTYSENLNITRPMLHFVGKSARQFATFINGNAVINPSLTVGGSIFKSVVTFSNIFQNANTGATLTVTGSNAVGVVIEDSTLYALAGKALVMNNTGAGGNRLRLRNVDVTSGDTIEIANVVNAGIEKVAMGTNGAGVGLSINAQGSSVFNIDGLILTSSTNATLMSILGGTVNAGNCAFTSTKANGTGVLVAAGATFVSGQNAYSVPTGTGKIVDGPAGSVYVQGLNLSAPFTNTSVGATVTVIDMAASIPTSSLKGTVGITQGGTGAATAAAAFTALAPAQAANGGKFLTTDGTSASWATVATTPSVVKTVGVDAATIQGCIDLCTDASASKNYVVQIPPGRYTESLTLKGSVMLQAMGANTLDTSTVQITGNHTLTGSATNPLTNRVTMGNIVFVNTSATVPTFTLSGTTATQVNINGCYLQANNVATTVVALSIGAGATVYMRQCIVDMANALAAGTNGGTQFSMVGGNLYLENVSSNGGTAIVNMTTAGYVQAVSATLACGGANAVSICANGSFLMGYATVENQATTGNGINITGAGGGAIGAFSSTFNINNAATSYVVTGVAGTAFFQLNNNYVNIPGVITKNVKIKNTVTMLTYASAMTSSA